MIHDHYFRKRPLPTIIIALLLAVMGYAQHVYICTCNIHTHLHTHTHTYPKNPKPKCLQYLLLWSLLWPWPCSNTGSTGSTAWHEMRHCIVWWMVCFIRLLPILTFKRCRWAVVKVRDVVLPGRPDLSGAGGCGPLDEYPELRGHPQHL